MTLLEWWRWHRHLARQRRRCERDGHSITGPHPAAGGFLVYTCLRCSYRFRADKVIVPGVNDE